MKFALVVFFALYVQVYGSQHISDGSSNAPSNGQDLHPSGIEPASSAQVKLPATIDEAVKHALEKGTATDLTVALASARRDEALKKQMIDALLELAGQGSLEKFKVLVKDLKSFWFQMKKEITRVFTTAAEKDQFEILEYLFYNSPSRFQLNNIKSALASAVKARNWDLIRQIRDIMPRYLGSECFIQFILETSIDSEVI